MFGFTSRVLLARTKRKLCQTGVCLPALQHTLLASDLIRRRMPLIKVLTALVLALAVVYAWMV